MTTLATEPHPGIVVARNDSASVSPSETLLTNIRPHFQPIVTSRGHDIYAVEALLRLPEMTQSCDTLFRRWESTGEVVAIDLMMVRKVVAALSNSMAIKPACVGVNVSALTVAVAPDSYLREIMELAKVAQRVIIEITETYPVPDIAALMYFARKCKYLGIRLAFDDCTPQHEFCSQSLANRIRPSILKIDGPLLIDCYNRQSIKPIVRIIRLAKTIGAVVVAEHIETKAMMAWAARLGANLMQGYYFGKALPLAANSR